MRSRVHAVIVTYCIILIASNTPIIFADSDAEIDAAKGNQIGFKLAAKQVLSVMNKWARSWAQLESQEYISSYSPDYVGKGFPSHFAWAANRQNRLKNQKSINLSLTDVELSSSKQSLFTVTFTQHYKSDTYQDTTRKQLDFKLINDSWYIVAEKTLAKNKAAQ